LLSLKIKNKDEESLLKRVGFSLPNGKGETSSHEYY
jgi:hypothetical protein